MLASNAIRRREIEMAHAPKFLKLVNEAKKKIKETNVADVKRRADSGEKFLLVDVREDNEWTKGHLPGAVHMGKGVRKMPLGPLVVLAHVHKQEQRVDQGASSWRRSHG